jgi:threonine aldolase
MHLDGARMFNAVAAGAYTAAELAAPFDTVQFCLSKGLGAPVGSVLAGDGGTIDRARRLRKRLGGGWRQAGVLAAAGIHALENHVGRLAEDNARAKRLSEMLAGIDGIDARPEEVETNILFFTAGSPARDAEMEHALAGMGVLVEGGGHFPRVRAVTHLDVTDDDVERAVEAVRRFAG